MIPISALPVSQIPIETKIINVPATLGILKIQLQKNVKNVTQSAKHAK